MPTINENSIIFDHNDWLAGLHPQFLVKRPVLFHGYYNSDCFDGLRYLGYAAPGYDKNDVSNVSLVDALLRSICIGQDMAYAVGGNKIHSISKITGGLTSDAGVTFPITVTGATMSDVCRYDIGGTTYIFYSWNDDTDGEVGRTTEAAVHDDDYMSTVPTGAAVLSKFYEHPMIVGDDDVLYIGDGNVLKAFDGVAGTFKASGAGTLTLPNICYIKSFAKINPRTLVIFTQERGAVDTVAGQVYAWFWDYVAEDPYKKLVVYGNTCGGAFEAKNTIGVFTGGASPDRGTPNRYIHLNILSRAEERFIRSYSIYHTGGDIPIHGGVDVVGDNVSANIDGTIYSFDSSWPGLPVGLQKIAKGTGTSSGALKTLYQNRMLISSGTTTSGGLEILNQSTFDEGYVTTSYAEPGFPVGHVGKIKKVRVEFMEASDAGKELELTLYNRSGTSLGQVLDAVTSVTANQLILEKTEAYDGNAFKDFDALQMKMEWKAGSANTACPVVRRVIVYFELTKEIPQ